MRAQMQGADDQKAHGLDAGHDHTGAKPQSHHAIAQPDQGHGQAGGGQAVAGDLRPAIVPGHQHQPHPEHRQQPQPQPFGRGHRAGRQAAQKQRRNQRRQRRHAQQHDRQKAAAKHQSHAIRAGQGQCQQRDAGLEPIVAERQGSDLGLGQHKGPIQRRQRREVADPGQRHAAQHPPADRERPAGGQRVQVERVEGKVGHGVFQRIRVAARPGS
jgi:hypothetical protein